MELFYTIKLDTDNPIISIDKHIGFDEKEGVGIMGDQFRKELLFLDTLDKKSITVWINSPGGVITDGMEIYNAILKTKTPVDTVCVGMAASIAAVIFEAGRKRIMNDYGILMFHNPSGGDDKGLDTFKQSIITMICSRSGYSTEDMIKTMDSETWMNADECLSKKLCDEVVASDTLNKPRRTADVKDTWHSYQTVCNSIFNINNQISTTMKKNLCVYLNLCKTDATEEIVNEITDSQIEVALNAKKKAEADEAENKTKSEDDKKKLEADLVAAKKAKKKADASDDEDEIDKCNAKIKSLEDELDKFKKKMEADDKKKNEADDKAKEEADDKKKAEAEDFVNAKVITGHIPNVPAVKAMYVKNLISDFKGTKEAIDALPLNKQGVNVSNLIEKDDKGNVILPTSAATKMGEIKAKHDKIYKA